MEEKARGRIELSKVRALKGNALRAALLVYALEAQNAERFLDMYDLACELVRHVALENNWLTEKERRCIATAFKNVTCQLRAAWSAVPIEDTSDEVATALEEYREHIKQQLIDHCTGSHEVLSAMNQSSFAANAADGSLDSKVFVMKMVADYHRYLAEVSKGSGEGRRAIETYEYAMELAEGLDATNPVRIGLALNLSVCYYECVKDTSKAVEVAKDAFNKAIAKLDRIVESHYNDTTLIMQLLRDNITSWSGSSSDNAMSNKGK